MNIKSLFFTTICILQISNQLQAASRLESFIANFTYPDCLVFDVGAHHGKKTDLYLANNCKVVCFEPQPNCFKRLQKKFAKNPDVTIEQIGLSSQEGQLEMYICSKATTISTLSTEWVEDSRFSKLGFKWDKKIVIPTQTLDAMIAKYGLPQFCKIDVENHELEVLKGLTQPIPYISFELAIETFSNTLACLDYLENLGYKKFNCAFGEIPELLFTTWFEKQEFVAELQRYLASDRCKNPRIFWGDVYAAFN